MTSQFKKFVIDLIRKFWKSFRKKSGLSILNSIQRQNDLIRSFGKCFNSIDLEVHFLFKDFEKN